MHLLTTLILEYRLRACSDFDAEIIPGTGNRLGEISGNKVVKVKFMRQQVTVMVKKVHSDIAKAEPQGQW